MHGDDGDEGEDQGAFREALSGFVAQPLGSSVIIQVVPITGAGNGLF